MNLVDFFLTCFDCESIQLVDCDQITSLSYPWFWTFPSTVEKLHFELYFDVNVLNLYCTA